MALIDVRIKLPLNILRNFGLLLHAKHCSGAIVRFSDISSLIQVQYTIAFLHINVSGWIQFKMEADYRDYMSPIRKIALADSVF